MSVLGLPPFHATSLTSSGALSYVGGNWERDIAFAGYSIPLAVSPLPLLASQPVPSSRPRLACPVPEGGVCGWQSVGGGGSATSAAPLAAGRRARHVAHAVCCLLVLTAGRHARLSDAEQPSGD